MSHHSALPCVGVIGAGRVGSVLAARFVRAGYRLVGIAARSDASRLRAATLIPSADILTPVEIVRRSEVVVLAVPDDQLASVARELAPHTRRDQIVLHTSGRHGLAVLDPMTDVRAVAFHPAMSFTGTEVDVDRSSVFGLTAAAADRDVVETLVADLGGTPMWIDEADRVRYHAALAHGANNITTIVTQAMDLLRSIGAQDPAAALRPLLEATLENTLRYGDAALTGPVARGDIGTVRAHLEALDDADIEQTYRALAQATARRAGQDEIAEALLPVEDRS